MAEQKPEDELRIGVYICHCGSNIAGVIDPAEVAEWATHLPGVGACYRHPVCLCR